MSIINLTAHKATAEQKAAGVVDVSDSDFYRIANLLRFEKVPTLDNIIDRAHAILGFAEKYKCGQVLIDGPAYLIPSLETQLATRSIEPIYELTPSSAVFVRPLQGC